MDYTRLPKDLKFRNPLSVQSSHNAAKSAAMRIYKQISLSSPPPGIVNRTDATYNIINFEMLTQVKLMSRSALGMYHYRWAQQNGQGNPSRILDLINSASLESEGVGNPME